MKNKKIQHIICLFNVNIIFVCAIDSIITIES